MTMTIFGNMFFLSVQNAIHRTGNMFIQMRPICDQMQNYIFASFNQGARALLFSFDSQWLKINNNNILYGNDFHYYTEYHFLFGTAFAAT